MSAWVLSLIGVVLISCVITIILPDGRLGKVIKGICSLVITLVIIYPLLSKDSINSVFVLDDNNIQIDVQEEYVNYVFESRAEQTINEIINLVENKGVKDVICDVGYEKYNGNNNFTINFILINLNNAVIISDKEHILVIEEIISIVSQQFELDKNKIVIYE